MKFKETRQKGMVFGQSNEDVTQSSPCSGSTDVEHCRYRDTHGRQAGREESVITCTIIIIVFV